MGANGSIFAPATVYAVAGINSPQDMDVLVTRAEASSREWAKEHGEIPESIRHPMRRLTAAHAGFLVYV